MKKEYELKFEGSKVEVVALNFKVSETEKQKIEQVLRKYLFELINEKNILLIRRDIDDVLKGNI